MTPGVAFACFAFGWIGGGDAKFAAAIILWLGPAGAMEFLIYAGLFGGLLTIVLLSFRGRLLPAFALRQDWLLRLHDPKAGVPYGVALSAAALVVYPNTAWLGLAVGSASPSNDVSFAQLLGPRPPAIAQLPGSIAVSASTPRQVFVN